MQINDSIKKLRELRNYTQEYMALQIGKTRKTYAQIENGDLHPKQEVLEKIAKALSVSVNDILNFNCKDFLQTVFKDKLNEEEKDFLCNNTNNIDELKKLYLKLIDEKDLRIKTLEEMISILKKR